MRRLLRLLIVLLAALLLAALGGAVWAGAQLRASLPQLDGPARLAGLTAPVVITRDGLGIPTIRGGSRVDVARATGFLHAQERFFQMDLAWRRAAGELAALVGGQALAVDYDIRIHRFRAQAERAVSLLSTDAAATLAAYTEGANAGLDALGAPPFDYLVLRQDPEPWRPEDSLLVILSMFITLQDADRTYEATLATMHDVLPEPRFEFLAPRGSEWDAPILGLAFDTPAIPGPDIYDLRSRRRQRPTPNIRRPISDRVDLGVGRRNHGIESWGAGIGERAREQQLRGCRRADDGWGCAARERHAPEHSGAEHLVSSRAGMAGPGES